MPYNYVPDPRHTQHGQVPKVGQAGIYEDQQGNEFPGMIIGLLGPIANGNYGVVFRRLKPNASQMAADPSVIGNPASDDQDGWQFNPRENRIYWCPHNPPDPNVTCP